MAERKLVGFDLTGEDIPPSPGHDWRRETPYAASMAHEDLRVTSEQHPGRFYEVLSLAIDMFGRANEGKGIQVKDKVQDENGELIACTITVKET